VRCSPRPRLLHLLERRGAITHCTHGTPRHAKRRLPRSGRRRAAARRTWSVGARCGRYCTKSAGIGRAPSDLSRAPTAMSAV
jgi:hypothetical protein